MSRKRNAANLKLQDFEGDRAAARVGFHRNVFSRGWEFTAPATKIAKAKIAKAKSEKYRRLKK